MQAVSPDFYMVIFTWYFKFLLNNMGKTMWNPCKTLSKFHILFTWNSDTFHRASPSSELEVWIVQAPITRDPDKKKIINTCTLLLFSGLPLPNVMLMGHSLSTARFVKFLTFFSFLYTHCFIHIWSVKCFLLFNLWPSLKYIHCTGIHVCYLLAGRSV